MKRVALSQAPAAIVAATAPKPQARTVILLDGGSGAGKTSLASAVAQLWQTTHHRALLVVSLDEIYPGWHGLAAALSAVPRLLAPTNAGYRRWDWTRAAPSDWVDVDPTVPILVEGCGALSRESAPLASYRVWLEGDEPTRKVRALARDQGTFDAHWDEWAAQEHAHWQANQPWALADLVVEGTRLPT